MQQRVVVVVMTNYERTARLGLLLRGLVELELAPHRVEQLGDARAVQPRDGERLAATTVRDVSVPEVVQNASQAGSSNTRKQRTHNMGRMTR